MHLFKPTLRDILFAVSSPDCSPQLGLALAHDFGFVADLRWCPSGCWEAEDEPCNENPGLRRLGLVALACGDGAVRILR